MDIYTFKTPRPQHFSLPYPIMKYILKNATPKAWKKLIQTCKYFFPKNPVFPVYDLQADDNGKWHGDDGRINTNNPVAKLWLYNILFAFHSGLSPTTISSLIPKLSNCSLKAVLFTGQNLTWNEFQFLTSSGSIEWFDFCDCTLKYSDGKFVTFDKVLENFKNVESFTFGHINPSMFEPDTVKNMVKLLPHFKKLDYFGLYQLTETFDIFTFTDFLLQHETCQTNLAFNGTISDAFKLKIDKCYEKIIKNPPKNLYSFWYLGMNQTQFKAYEKLYEIKF